MGIQQAPALGVCGPEDALRPASLPLRSRGWITLQALLGRLGSQGQFFEAAL